MARVAIAATTGRAVEMAKTVEIAVVVEHETDAALLVDHGGGPAVWVPKSQLGDETDVEGKGDAGVVELPEWLAIEKGMI
jgi:hypothetical protein